MVFNVTYTICERLELDAHRAPTSLKASCPIIADLIIFVNICDFLKLKILFKRKPTLWCRWLLQLQFTFVFEKLLEVEEFQVSSVKDGKKFHTLLDGSN